MTDILFATQQAVYAALSGTPALQALIGAPARLYDHAPPGLTFPYVTFGALHVAPYDTKTETGFEQTVTLDIWSRYRGQREAQDILQAIYTALHRATLTISGATFLLCEFHSADLTPLDDGITTHAAVRFTVMAQGA